MTDTTKYKNVSLPIVTYDQIDEGRRKVVKGMVLSRPQYISWLINGDHSQLKNRKRKNAKPTK
tara:strand:- start:471 stop:659 length:189 start_codon:yes stop_codon:yes gene_type:complete